jgi:hypothetical protein
MASMGDPDKLQPNRNLPDIRQPHGVAIHGGGAKRRLIALGLDIPRQHAAQGL